jgi:Arm DNA-binding domain
MAKTIKRLTDTKIKTARPGPGLDNAGKLKRKLIPDGAGIYLQVTQGATAADVNLSWLLRYKGEGGKERWLGLGAYPQVTLAAARERAIAEQAKVNAGTGSPGSQKGRSASPGRAAEGRREGGPHFRSGG